MAILLYILLAYIAYRFIFGFLIPVIRTTRQVRKQFREMRSRMQGGYQEEKVKEEVKVKEEQNPKVGDYIDYEELK